MEKQNHCVTEEDVGLLELECGARHAAWCCMRIHAQLTVTVVTDSLTELCSLTAHAYMCKHTHGMLAAPAYVYRYVAGAARYAYARTA